jgi:hypothetical protein
MKTRKFNKYKDKKTKWITPGILKSLKYRDKLIRKCRKATGGRKEVLDTQLHKYSKILTRCTKNAKKLYYDHIFRINQGDLRKTWENINSVLGKVQKVDYPDFFLDSGGNKITHLRDIADSLNEYFSNIGENLAAEIDTGGVDQYLTYLT